MKKASLIVLLLLIFIGVKEIFAEDVSLERIVVTPSRIEEEGSDISRNVDVVTAQDIERACANDLSEVLDGLTSVNISNYGALGATKNLRMRGSSAAQVLVLIDGRPINNPRDGAVELSDIPLENVERLEVMHGPASSMYGAGAMAGTVNIITKKLPKEKQKTKITSSFGTHRTYIEKLSHGARVGKLGYIVTGEYKSSEGFRVNSEFNAKDANAKFEYEFSDNNKLSLNSGFYKSRLGAPGTLSSPDSDDKQAALKNFIDLGWNFKFNEETGISAKAYQNHDRLEFIENTAGSIFDTAMKKDIHTTIARGIDLSLNKQIFDNYTIVCGFNYVTNLNDSTNSAKHKYTVRAAYLENKIDLTDKLGVNVSTRIDDYSNFGTELSPGISALYKVSEGFKFHALLSRSFRAPTFNDLYWPDEGWAVGNPNVKPEKGITAEIGIESKLNKYLLTGLTYYRNDFNDLINWAESAGVWTPTNVGSSIMDGIEFVNSIYLTDVLSAGLNYTYLRAVDDKTNKYLIYQPKYKVDFSLKYNNLDGLFIELKSQFTDKRYHDAANTIKVKRFCVFGLDISKKIREGCSGFISINNLFNLKYQVIRDYPLPGFDITTGVKLEF